MNIAEAGYVIMGSVIQEVKTANIAREVCQQLFLTNFKLKVLTSCVIYNCL